jgi:dTDP-4-dehydrorhamnose 3,5-epimerase
MKVTPTALPEVLLIEPRVFGDSRGFFLESWNQRTFDEAVGSPVQFVQDNHSRSAHGVLRGIHYQLTRPQGKLVRVTSGQVFDVAVDLRRSSPRCGKWVGFELDAESHRQLWIPPGFGHAFVVLSPSADFLYKTSDYYAPADERSIRWDDPTLAIGWPLDAIQGAPVLSARDASATPFNAADLHP